MVLCGRNYSPYGESQEGEGIFSVVTHWQLPKILSLVSIYLLKVSTFLDCMKLGLNL